MSSNRWTVSWIWLTVAPLLALMTLAACMRFYEIGRLPLWLDEAYSFWFSRQSFESLWTFVPTFETHPPVYYSLLRLWRVFGDDEAALRSLSAVLGILAVAAVYLLGRIVGGPRDGAWVGFGAGLIVAISPIQIQYAQEARSMMAVTLIVSVTLCGAAWLMRHSSSACQPYFGWAWGAPDSGYTAHPSPKWAWLALIGGSAASLWLHNLAPVFVFSVATAMIAWLAFQLAWNRSFVLNGVLACVAVFMLWSPWLPWLLKQVEAVSMVFWMKAPTLIQTIGAIYFFFGAKYSWPIEAYAAQPALLSEPGSIGSADGLAGGAIWLVAHLGLGALGVTGLWLVGRRYGWQLATLLVSVMILPILLTLLATFTIRPVFAPRTLIWVSVPFYVAVATGVTVTSRTWLRGLFLAALFILFGYGSLNYYADHEKEPWDQIAEMVKAGSAPGDVIVVVPNSVEIPLAYYLRDREANLPVYGLPAPFPATGLTNPYPAGIAAVPAMTPVDVPALRSRIDGLSSGWLITRADGVFDTDGLVVKTLTEDKSLSLRGRHAKDNILVYRFE